MSRESSQRSAVGQEYGEVIEAEPSAAGYQQSAWPLLDADQRCRILLGRERRLDQPGGRGCEGPGRAHSTPPSGRDRPVWSWTGPSRMSGRQPVAGRWNREVVGAHLGLPNPLSLAILPPPRTGVRVAEGAGLENRYTRKGIVGSNPTLSALFPPQYQADGAGRPASPAPAEPVPPARTAP